MKSLFLSIYMYTPHFETELELMSGLLAMGKDVTVVGCRGQLPSCEMNPQHLRHICVLCRSKFENGMKRIGISKDKILDFPQENPDYSDLPNEFNNTESLMDFCIDGENLGRGAASSLISRINKDPHFDTIQHKSAVLRELQASYFIYYNLKKLLLEHRPTDVYLFNGRFSTTYPLVLLCRKLGIPFYTHERAGVVERFILRKNCLPHDLSTAHSEIESLWNSAPPTRNATGSAWFEGRRQGIETAWTSYITHQSAGKLPESFNSSYRNIAIFSSTLEEFATIPGYENPFFKDEVEALRYVLERFCGEKGIRFYLRMHPNMRNIPVQNTYQLREVDALAKDHHNLEVIWPASPVHTYALMDAANSVLTFGSTMGIEANFWGRPSILMGRGFYEELGGNYRPKNRDELIELLGADLAPKETLAALKYGYWEYHRGIAFTRFQPSGIFGGMFEGAPIKASRMARLRSLSLQVSNVGNPKELGALIQEKAIRLGIAKGSKK